MSALLLGAAAAWTVLRLAGADLPWPWRVAELTSAPPARRRPDRSRRRRDQGRSEVPPAHAADDTRSTGPRERLRRRGRADVAEDLVLVIDLLGVGVSAGLNLHGALSSVATLGSGPVAAALADVDAAVRRGQRLVDALSSVPATCGASVRPLVTTLLAAHRSGSALAPALQRLADAERRRARRRAEERVRRLPVLLLAPLVGLVLPAFVVLTIVPVAWTTARVGLAPASA